MNGVKNMVPPCRVQPLWAHLEEALSQLLDEAYIEYPPSIEPGLALISARIPTGPAPAAECPTKNTEVRPG